LIMAVIPLFFPASGATAEDVTASPAQVLSGYTAVTTASDDPVDGTMPTRAGQNRAASEVDVSGANLRLRVNDYGYYNTNSRITTPLSNLGNAAASDVLDGKTFTSSAGLAVEGTIPSKAATTYNASTSAQTIAAGQYLSGAQTIRAIKTANISAGNIKSGVNVTVGDTGSATRIANVTGTYTNVSSGQNAVVAGALLKGYSGFANGGAEVKGSIVSKAAATYDVSASDRTIDSGLYLSGVQTIKAVSTTGITAANIKSGVNVKVGDSNNAGRLVDVTGTYTNVSSGQTAVSAGALLEGYSGFANGGAEVKGTMGNLYNQTVAIDGDELGGSVTFAAATRTATLTIPNSTNNRVRNTKITAVIPMTTNGGGTKYATTSEQTVVAANTFLTGALKIGKLSQTNLTAANIKKGVNVRINNGSANVFNVTGTCLEMKNVSTTAVVSTAKDSFVGEDGTTARGFYIQIPAADVQALGIEPYRVVAIGFRSTYGGFGSTCGRTGCNVMDGEDTGYGISGYYLFSDNSGKMYCSSTAGIRIPVSGYLGGDTVDVIITGCTL
jgi:hypothetical protein